MPIVDAIRSVPTRPIPTFCPEDRDMRWDLHTHYYPDRYFDTIRDVPSEFSFDKDPTGRTIITFRGARFFGITPPTDFPAEVWKELARQGRLKVVGTRGLYALNE